MSEPTDGSPGLPRPEAPARRADDLPPNSPWWALWIESNWPKWAQRIKRTGAAFVVVAPQLYEYLPQAGFHLSDQALHNLTSLLGLVVLFGTLEKRLQPKGDSNDRAS